MAADVIGDDPSLRVEPDVPKLMEASGVLAYALTNGFSISQIAI
jgi:hypothetical protein